MSNPLHSGVESRLDITHPSIRHTLQEGSAYHLLGIKLSIEEYVVLLTIRQISKSVKEVCFLHQVHRRSPAMT